MKCQQFRLLQEKKILKEEKLKLEEKYMWAIVDGVKEKVLSHSFFFCEKFGRGCQGNFISLALLFC